MVSLEFSPERVPLIKLALHTAQILFAFIAWCLEISVFAEETAEINGNNGWPFGLFFLTIPAWIYLSMAPRFPRTRKFAEPRVMAVVDGVFAVLWLSAFASQAAFNSAGDCGERCSESKAVVGLAFFVFLFFIGSTTVSIYTVKYWQWNNGRLPGYDKMMLGGGDSIDPHKAAFSADIHDDEAQYAAVHADDQDDRDDDHNTHTNYGDDGGYSTVGSRYGHTDIDGGYGSGRTDLSYNDTETDYRPQTAATSSVGGHLYNPPSAQDDYDDGRPAQFPSANYGR